MSKHFKSLFIDQYGKKFYANTIKELKAANMNTQAFCNSCMIYLERYEIMDYEDGIEHCYKCDGGTISYQQINEVQS